MLLTVLEKEFCVFMEIRIVLKTMLARTQKTVLKIPMYVWTRLETLFSKLLKMHSKQNILAVTMLKYIENLTRVFGIKN